MSLNPFATVGDYPAMLNKIAWWTFFTSLLATLLVRWRLPVIDAALEAVSFGVKVPVAGNMFSLGSLIPAFTMALVSRVSKLHDRLSDLLGIRKRFDRQEILLPMAAASGATLTPDQLQKIDAHRNNLMGH